jgi:hypothetical protein
MSFSTTERRAVGGGGEVCIGCFSDILIALAVCLLGPRLWKVPVFVLY